MISDMDEELRKLAEADLQGMNASYYIGQLQKLTESGAGFVNDTSLFDILDGIILDDCKGEFVRKLCKGNKLFRARVISPYDYSDISKGLSYDDDRCYGYNWENSKEPPAEKTEEARNSVKGEQALYIASDAITACCEVKSTLRQRISIAEFELSEDIEYIDFSKQKYNVSFLKFNSKYNTDIQSLISYFLSLFSFPVYSEEEYKATQKIVGHFRKLGYKGFKYRSFYTDGFNYTFFGDLMSKFVYIDSRVFINYSMANLFVSLDKNATEQDDLTNRYKINAEVNERIRGKFWNNTIKEFRSKNT